jgi:hypothetical protein
MAAACFCWHGKALLRETEGFAGTCCTYLPSGPAVVLVARHIKVLVWTRPLLQRATVCCFQLHGAV